MTPPVNFRLNPETNVEPLMMPAQAQAMVTGLDPTAVLGRGYAIVQHGGSVLRTPALVGSEIDITLSEGGMECQVTKTRS